MEKKIKHKVHFSKYSFKQFVIPYKQSSRVLYEGNIEDVKDSILEQAKISRQVLMDKGVKFINIWE